MPDTHVQPAPPSQSGWCRILDHKQEVMFRDGHTVQLHDVQIHDTPIAFMRAVQFEESYWRVFDLRHIAKSLSQQPSMLPREFAGVVFQTLRMAFPTVEDFRAHVESCLAGFDTTGVQQ